MFDEYCRYLQKETIGNPEVVCIPIHGASRVIFIWPQHNLGFKKDVRYLGEDTFNSLVDEANRRYSEWCQKNGINKGINNENVRQNMLLDYITSPGNTSAQYVSASS